MFEFRVNVSFSGKLLHELTLDGFGMQSNYLYCVFIGRNCFQEMILTRTLQVLQGRQPGGTGSCRSSRSSQPLVSDGRGGFPFLS